MVRESTFMSVYAILEINGQMDAVAFFFSNSLNAWWLRCGGQWLTMILCFSSHVVMLACYLASPCVLVLLSLPSRCRLLALVLLLRMETWLKTSSNPCMFGLSSFTKWKEELLGAGGCNILFQSFVCGFEYQCADNYSDMFVGLDCLVVPWYSQRVTVYLILICAVIQSNVDNPKITKFLACEFEVFCRIDKFF